MSYSVTTGGTMTVNGETLHVTEMEPVGPTVETLDCQVPDLRWTSTDTNGHEHRWWLRGDEPDGRREQEAQTPTLTKSQQHIECDGSCPNWDCEGYSITVWHCIVCGEQVEPKFRPGTTTITTSTGYWILTVEGDDLSPAVFGAGPDVLRWPAVVVEYPSGPGQMTRMTGEARQINHRRYRRAAEPMRDVREFQFMPNVPI